MAEGHVYTKTILTGVGLGLGMIVIPEVIKSMFGWPVAEPIAMGIIVSLYSAFCLSSVFGPPSMSIRVDAHFYENGVNFGLEFLVCDFRWQIHARKK